MPCLEISLPKISNDTKATLATELTRAFCETTGHDAEIFGIRFFEYEPGCAAQGGKLFTDNAVPPYLHLLLYCPRLKRSVKQILATRLTETFVKAANQPNWSPVIHICEHPYDNVVVQGIVLSDLFEECAKRPFYYDLPGD